MEIATLITIIVLVCVFSLLFIFSITLELTRKTVTGKDATTNNKKGVDK